MQTHETPTGDAEAVADRERTRAQLAVQTVTLLDVFEVASQVEAEADKRVLTPGAATRRMAHLLQWRAAISPAK